MSVDDAKIVYRFKEKIKCGNIYFVKRRKREWKDEIYYRVSSHFDIHTKVIPFFNIYLLGYTNKYKQFKIWTKKYYNNGLIY